MSLLMRNASVTTRYGGGFVQSIDGLSGGQRGGAAGRLVLLRQRRRGEQGRGATNVNAGDHIWWDRHDWSQTDDMPAVVGSFPQPFLNGHRRQAPAGASRMRERRRLRLPHGHRAAARAGRAGGDRGDRQRRRAAADAARGGRTLARDRRRLRRARDSKAGPRASGVYARFARERGAERHDAHAARRGRRTRADARRGRRADRGHAQRRRRAGVGRHGHRCSGRRRARRARSSGRRSRNRFAVAVEPSGPLALPRPGA